MNIRQISDILRTTYRYKYDQISVLDLTKAVGGETKYGQFLELLLNKTFTRDEEVAQILYGSPHPGTRLMFMKSDITSKLLNNVLFLDLETGSRNQATKAYYKARKLQIAISIFVRLGCRTPIKTLGKKALVICERFQFTAISLDILTFLRQDALQSGSAPLLKKYTKKLDNMTQVFVAENRLISIDNNIRIQLIKSLSTSKNLQTNAKKYIEDTIKIKDKHSSFLIETTYYRILYCCYQILGDIEKSLKACEDASEYLRKHYFSEKAPLAEFALYQMENQMLLKNFLAGKVTANECEKYLVIGTTPWFKYKEYYFLLSLQTSNFEEAASVYNEVVNHKSFFVQQIHLQERWKIFGLYVAFLVREPGETTPLLRYKKFRERVKDFPSYTKDKRGYNISILIINILLLLESNRKIELLDQMEALSSYRTKYLRHHTVNQSAALFKLLRIMLKEEFDYNRIKARSAELEAVLDAPIVNPHEVFEYIQILPPKWVWNKILSILKEQGNKKPAR